MQMLQKLVILSSYTQEIVIELTTKQFQNRNRSIYTLNI